MTRILVALLAFLIAAPMPAMDAELETLARTFAATFAQREPRAFDALAATPPASGSNWERVAELLERNRAITLEVVSVRPDAGGDPTRIQVETVGRITPHGPGKSERELRYTWMLEVERADERWAIRSTDRAERVVAMRIAQAAAADRQAILDRHRDLDLRWIARELADLTLFKAPFAGRVDLADYALALARPTGDARTVVMTMYARVIAVMLTEGDKKAITYSAEVLEAARQSGDPDAIASALFMRGNRTADVSMLHESVSMIAELEDPRVALKALTVAANLLGMKGDLEGVNADAQLLETLSRNYRWREGEMNALLLQSSLHLKFGYNSLAAREMQELYEMATAEGNERIAATAAFNVALLTPSSDPHLKIDLLERSMPMVDRHLLPWSRAQGRVFLADAYMRAGCPDDAEPVLAEALTINPPIKGMILRYLAMARVHAKRYEPALAAARDSIEALVTQTPISDELSFSRLAAAAALRGLGRDAEAQTELEQAVALIEASVAAFPSDAIARMRYIENRIGPYLGLIDVLVDHGKAREALLIAERMRAGALRGALEDRNVDLSASMTEEEKKAEREVEARIVEINRRIGTASGNATLTELKAELDRARAAAIALRSDLYMRRPGLRTRRSGTREDLDLGPSDAAAIEFVVGSERTVVFVKDTRGTVSSVIIPAGLPELRKRVRKLTDALRSRSLTYGREARELYDLLIGPIEARLEPGRALCIVPDRVLWDVPFHALQDRNGRHLIETRPVFYSTSIALSVRSQPKSAGPTLLAFGNPKLATTTVSRARGVFREAIGTLPEAETEVKALGSLYGRDKSRVYIGASARESAFKSEAASYSVLHIASHGVIDDSAPMFSALLLATTDDAKEDGLLEAREILDLRLNADLAVLSACHTAGAQSGPGEGIIGLSWAFLAAGCPTTVVSQWKAESAATSKLMIAFHKSLVAGRTPAAALREAQLALLRDRRFAHPLYWATFVVMGADE